MKLFLSVFLTLLLSACSQQGFISDFANNAELIAKTDNKTPTLDVKIYKLSEQGECSADVCPQQRLYIAVSEFGEDPEQMLYKTQLADNWVFSKWKQLPTLGQLPYSVSFEVQKTLDTAKYTQEITVSLEGIEYREQ